MKALKIILIILVVVIGGYFIWMATLPADYNVERTTVVDAKPEVVYDYVSDFETWPEWSIWFEKDSTMKTVYGDKTQGKGAAYSWTSTSQGNGNMTFTEAEENKSLKSKIVFEGMGESDGYWKFEPTEDGKTKVTWGFSGTFPLYARIAGQGMDEAVGPDFEAGLNNMKEKVEALPKTETAPADISVTQVESMPYYGITDEVSKSDINSEFFAQRFEAIATYLGEDMKNTQGPPFAIYHVWDEDNDIVKVEVAMAVASSKPGNDKIKKGNTYAGTVVKGIHLGSYDESGNTHWAIDDYMKANNYEMVGSPWEAYVTGPNSEPDTTKWVTEIYYPVMPSGTATTK